MTQRTSITLTLNEIQAERLFSAFSENAVSPPQYAQWCLKCENCTITRYTSGKTVFQGKDAEVYASPFTADVPSPEASVPSSVPQAGSDEVGTGDYFGPVTVCAVYADSDGIRLIRSLNAHDSKQIKDADIRAIAPKLMEALPHSLLIVPDAKYNQVHEKDNLNAIKAKLHNQAYVNLRKKTALPSLAVVDQFAPEASYYRYLRNEREVVRGIHFETKAEDRSPAVGAASVIARYAFLRCMDEMDRAFDMHFPYGAGNAVDEAGRRFVAQYGKQRLHEVAKLHFKNTDKILG